MNKNTGLTYPLMVVVFIFFSIVGMVLPVLPLQVHDVLGFGPFVVGIVAGCQFAVALITRFWAGRLADNRGAKYAVRLGFCGAIAGGLLYCISMFFLQQPTISVILLLLGRALSGGSESLVITGSIVWALQSVDAGKSGKVISWVGMSLFAALAVGAPLGGFIFHNWGFLGISITSVLAPIAALIITHRLNAFVPQPSSEGQGFFTILGAVALPGTAFALAGITFGAITTFLTLLFSVRSWSHGSLAFALFALMLIIVRVAFGHYPDRFGGAKITLYSLMVQIVGLGLVAGAGSPGMAMVGAALAGAGFALVYPGLCIEILRRVPAENRGIAMGSYNACLDITLGFGSPMLGYIAGQLGMASVFSVSAVAAVLAVVVTLVIILRNKAVFSD